MKYEITYLKPKKKGYAKHTAVFLKIDDAIAWESYVKDLGAKNIIITPR